MAFDGHSATSSSKAVYTTPNLVCPADRIYAADTDADGKPDVYSPAAFASAPGVSARQSGYPRAD